MNARIKQLAEQARKEYLKLPTGYRPEQVGMYRELMEKFAELIVQDCVEVVEGGSFLHDQAPTAIFARECSIALKRHFGVEK